MSRGLFGRRDSESATARRAMLALCIGAAIATAVVSVVGQEQRPAAREAPKPWPPVRLPDGQPNVTGGIWRAPSGGTGRLDNPIATNTAFSGPNAPKAAPSRIIDPPDGKVPYQPWAAARKKQQEIDLESPTRPEHIDTQARCITAMPRLGYYVSGYRIMQTPGFITFLWEIYHQYRVIPVDGSPHIGPSLKLWMGDARGRWEGNTLHVETTNHNGKIRLTSSGDFFTDKVRFTERFEFINADTMNWYVTIDDPTVYTRPWTMRVEQKRGPDDEMWEESCHEGDLDRPSAPAAVKP